MTEVIYLTPKELTDRWKLSDSTLRAWRHRNKGPHYQKIGGLVRYHLEDIIRFENENMISSKKCG